MPSSIGKEAFWDKGLTSVTIPDSVTSIGEAAFSVNQLTNITLTSNITNIGSYAFSNNLLTSVSIPDSITIINASTFFGNQLTSVEIPNSVETIEFRAFEENKLTSVTIPSSVTSIKPRAFWGNLLTSMTILDSVTTIGWQAFASNQLTTISLGKNVTSIDSQAFYQNQLTSVIIPNSVKAIGQNSFTKNPVREASIPDSIQHILVKGYIVSDNPSIAEVAVECFDNPGILLLQSVKNLKAVSSALNKITITWSACTGADGYVLYRQAPGETKMSHRYIMAGKGFIDTVEQDGFYFYRVYPYVMVGDDHIFGPSDTYVYALAPVPPPAVTNLKAKATRTSATVSWTAVDNVDGYIIYRKAPGETRMSYRTIAKKTGLVDTATKPGFHFYRVYPYRMINGKQVSGPSTQYVYTNVTMEPAPVGNLKVTSVGKTAQLRWTAADDADGYILYRRAPGESKMSYLYILTGTGFNDVVITPGYYFYRVYPYRMIDGQRILGKSEKHVYTHIK